MTFLNPIYFLWLLGLIPLAAVYFLKVRPKRRSVNALFLWEAVLDQKKHTALFNRLRNLLSLLLLVLALVAVVLAMCAPELAHDERRDLLLLIDNSASMSAVDRGGTRLAAAKQIACEIVQGLNADQQAAVATLSLDVRYQSHFTNSPKTLLEAVKGIGPSDCPFRPEALARLGAGIQSMARCRIILISDGLRFVADPNSPVELIKVGAAQDNIGFVTCDLRMLRSHPIQVGLYYKLASSYSETVTADMVITQDAEGRILKVLPISVKPGINTSKVLTLDVGRPGPWRVTLDIEDALLDDNVAFLALQSRPPVRVKVVSDRGFFLLNSVKAFANTSGALVAVQDDPEVVLAGGVVPQAPRSIVFGVPQASGWWGRVGSEIDDVFARIRIEDHPILKDCQLDALAFVGARDVTPPPGSLVLVETAQRVPLIYRVQDGQRSAVVINMDPASSEFYYSAWFPVLVYNCARHLMGRDAMFLSACAVGASIPMPTALEGDGQTTVLPADSNDPLVVNGPTYGPIRRRGFYRFDSASTQWSVGANLFAAQETLLNNKHVKDTSRALNRGRPLAFVLAMLALGLLLLECLLYHRRKVG